MNNNYSIKYIIRTIKINPIELRLLLSYITKFSNIELITRDEYILSQNEYTKLISCISKLKEGEPLNYIIGYKEFYGYKFIVTPNTLIPRPETELLVDLILKLANKNDNILDLGTGSGCIAISCKLEQQELFITAIDNNDKTLTVAKQNAILLNADVNFILSDWYNNIISNKNFNIIAANPPYIASNDKHLSQLSYEPYYALTDGNDGLIHIKTIIQHAQHYLTNAGYLLIEHGYNQASQVRQIFSNYGYHNISTIMDLAGHERVTMANI